MRFLTKVALATILISLFSLANINAQIRSGLPDRPEAKGFFYASERLKFPLCSVTSDMPYDIMASYIIADSITRNIGSIIIVNELAKNIWYGDTIAYALKYIYNMEDYSPIRFHKFLNTGSLYQDIPANSLYKRIVHKCLNWQYPYVHSSYILHIKINGTQFIGDEDGAICKSLTIVSCNVLDIIKGQILPDLNTYLYAGNKGTYLYESGKISNSQTLSEAGKVPNELLSTYPQTNLIFQYCNEWPRNYKSTSRSTWLYNYIDGGEPWIPDNSEKEYIVFLKISGGGGDKEGSATNYIYDGIIPVAGGLSFGMYPIVNGFVLDEGNYLGFGEAVPVDEFKQRLQEQIDKIKNCEE